MKKWMIGVLSAWSAAVMLAWSGMMMLAWSANTMAALPIQHWQLANGAQVYFVENHELPILDVSIDFPAGSAYDPTDQNGVAAMTQRMLDQGAGGLTDVQIASQVADVGALLGGDLDADRAGVSLRTLSHGEEQQAALALMTKVVDMPVFSQTVLDREKARVIEALTQSDGEPQSIVAVAFQRAVFAGHPYGHRQAGDIDTVKTLTSANLLAFYHAHYVANHAVVALIGDVTHDQANAVAQQLTSGLSTDVVASGAIPPVPALTQAVTKKITFPAQQSQILIGQPGVGRGDPDYFTLYVGNYVLGGGGFDSRLMEQVRQQRGLAYSVYSYFMPMREAGVFQIGLQTRTQQTVQALAVVQKTLADFLSQGVTEVELTQAKHSIIGGFPLRIDSNQKQLQYLAMIGFYQLPLDYLDQFPSKVADVTAPQIKAAFKRHIDPARMVTVIVGAESVTQP